ncbi:MAG: succinylglutamate desuccinylase/aspartoacylase family protein [Acidobacteria bacterium]|nr:succinylglutamate desuccinylase/aspartoacylase family protein [Acidobacteriota bacterium]
MSAAAICPITAGETRSATALHIEAGEHLIAAYAARSSGPTLIVIAGMHGNEGAGVRALQQLAFLLQPLQDQLLGRVYLIAGNTRALRKGVRFIDHDLNRAWTSANLDSSGRSFRERSVEGHELTEIDQLIDQILVTAQDEVYILDLHSTSAGGRPFATVGDTIRNRRFAQKFPVRLLLGIEEQLDGTMLEYLNNAGAVTLGFEGGRHGSPSTIDNHVAMTWLALVHADVLSADLVPDYDHQKRRLEAWSTAGRILEVRYREPVMPGDGFVMDQGFTNFDPVDSGQIVARNNRGPISAPESGMILMPLYQKLGEDGFFIIRTVAPFWLWLSGVVRNLRLPAVVHMLPGVSRCPDHPETLLVNTHIARFLPLQVFHLLGFRKRRWSGNRLVVSRRRHDTDSPFKRTDGR